MNKNIKGFSIIDDIENELKNDERVYNHKQRKHLAKNYLKSSKVPIENNSGDIIGVTNEYKKIRKKEKNNFKSWFDRVKKSQDYGQELHKKNTETILREQTKKTAELIKNKRIELFNIYEEKEAQELYNKFIENLKMNKK